MKSNFVKYGNLILLLGFLLLGKTVFAASNQPEVKLLQVYRGECLNLGLYQFTDLVTERAGQYPFEQDINSYKRLTYVSMSVNKHLEQCRNLLGENISFSFTFHRGLGETSDELVGLNTWDKAQYIYSCSRMFLGNQYIEGSVKATHRFGEEILVLDNSNKN